MAIVNLGRNSAALHIVNADIDELAGPGPRFPSDEQHLEFLLNFETPLFKSIPHLLDLVIEIRNDLCCSVVDQISQAAILEQENYRRQHD